ncbi:MAG: type 4a pilus biogenesis protein PilO [Patescibacteria group bacterium]
MNKEYITGTIFLIIAVIIYIIFIEPKYAEVKVTAESLIVKNNEFDGYSAFIKDIGNIVKESEGDLKSIQKIDSILPASKNTSDVLVRLDYIASRNGLLMKDVKFSNPVAKSQKTGKYSIIDVKLFLLGSYNSFLNFSKDIKSSNPLMDIIDIKFSNNKKDEDRNKETKDEVGLSLDPIFEFEMNISLYYQS